jgi:hypothetical protein
MRKRIDVMWRVAVVLLVVMALAPIAVTGGTTQAAGPSTQPPETYMDPIPDRINDAYPLGAWITGTSLEGASGLTGFDVVDVEVRIQRSSDNWYWDGVQWTADEMMAWQSCSVAPVLEVWTNDQYFWSHAPGFALGPGGDLDAGWSYTVSVRAVDANGYYDPSPMTDTFIYDDQLPDVSFVTNFPTRIYDLPQITGTAHDDCGDIAGVIEQVRMCIWDADEGYYWNGFFWQLDPVWIKCQGTNSWNIGQNTDPPLPDWLHHQNYEVWVQTSDNADNRDFEPNDLATPGYQFLYRHDFDSAGCYIDPLPQYATDSLPPFWDFMQNGFSGTSKAVPLQTIVQVAVEVRDVTDNVYWDDTLVAWQGSVDWVDCATDFAPVLDPLSGQYDWNVPIPVPGWQQGHTYQIRAEATDDSVTPKTYYSATESFTYDDIIPAPSNIDAFDDIVYNEWYTLTGNCEDDEDGRLATEVVHIIDSGGNYWNGLHWGITCFDCADPAGAWDWVFADGNFGTSAYVDWTLSGTTGYVLPPLVHNEVYDIEAFTFDLAGNLEATAVKQFEFRVDMSGYEPPAPTWTAGPTGTGGPTAPPGPTSTTIPTSTAPSATATATYTTPPVATATATATTPPAGFSGSGTVGTAGGTVTAKDGSGNTKVTADFASDAFSSSTAVTIDGSGSCVGYGAAPSGYSYGNSCFDIEPEGDLGAAVEVCVYYTSVDEAAAGGDASRLVLAYKNSGGAWVILDTTVNEGAGTLCAESTYVGSFAVLGLAEEEAEGWEWWYYLLIGLGALLIIAIVVLILVRPKEGEEMEFAEEEGYEEEEL